VDDEPNLYIGNGCLTKHRFKTGCLGYQYRVDCLVGDSLRILPGYIAIKHHLGNMFAIFSNHTNKQIYVIESPIFGEHVLFTLPTIAHHSKSKAMEIHP